MTDKLVRTIKAVSSKNKGAADSYIGFLTVEEDNHWYNVKADEKTLDILLESVIGKGNVIEFEVENGIPKNFVLKEKAKEGSNGIDDLTTFEELLSDAHKKFPDRMSIKTEMISHDAKEKSAVFKAKIEIFATEDQTQKFSIGDLSEESSNPVRLKMSEFEAYGDATQDNCGDMVKKHYLRMAETRAIARALRWTTNNAKCAAEETEEGELTEEQMQEAQEENMAKP